MLSPGYYSESKKTAVDSELERLYKQGVEHNPYPQLAARYFYDDGETINLTAKEWEIYAKEKGQQSLQHVTGVIKTPYYKNAPDKEKAKIISDVYSYSNALAKSKVSDYELDGWVEKAYRAKLRGVPVETYIGLKNTADTDGNNSISQQEYTAALVQADLTPAERAYMFRLQNEKWKKNPFEISEKTGVPMSAFDAYYAAESSKKPNGDTISGSLKRNTINAMVEAGATRQQAIKFWNEMYKKEK